MTAIGDVAKLIVRLTNGGSKFRPSLHFQATSGTTSLQALIDTWQAQTQAVLLGCLSQDMRLEGYSCEDVVPGTVATVHEDAPANTLGTQLTDSLPPQDAVLLSFKTGLKSRRARSRVYWPGATETAHQFGALTTSGRAPWDALVSNLTTNYVGTAPTSGWALCAYSPEELTAPKPPPTFKPRPGAIVTRVTSISLDTQIRSQRRRQTGVGQ